MNAVGSLVRPGRNQWRIRLAVLALLPLAGAAATGVKAATSEVKIVDIKAYAFLERAGALSEDLVGGAPLVNAPRGGAPDGDSATALLIDFTFEGDKNASPKDVSATVDLTQTNRAGEKIVTHKVLTDFRFGDDGTVHKAVFMDGATCMPLSIDARAGSTTKSARLDFQCDIVHAPK